MRIIDKLSDGADLFDALNSKVRIDIIELLLNHHELKMNDISEQLNIAKSALTAHIKKLEKCGIISVRYFTDKRGSQKLCKIIEDKLIINILPQITDICVHETDIDIGQYFDYEVTPTCGLASTKAVIGDFDDARYFSHRDRVNAGILWFTQGFVEYKTPNMLTLDDIPQEVQISLELCSEAPGVLSYYPSDINFTVNGKELGKWTSPGELFDRRGRFTPDWWFKNFPQYGRIKIITINQTGCYLDGLFLSPVTIDDLDLMNASEITFRLSVLPDSGNVGGVTLFGKSFGDYNSGINIKILYKKPEPTSN